MHVLQDFEQFIDPQLVAGWMAAVCAVIVGLHQSPSVIPLRALRGPCRITLIFYLSLH